MRRTTRTMVGGALAAACCALGARAVNAQQAPSAAPAGPPDLIHALTLPVWVSSTVANNSDRPDHLVDGNLETAWNSRTGELTTSHIDVWVPPGVTVDQLRLTAGYTRTTPRGDLFTQNHRVQHVRVYVGAPAGGASVTREFDLDVNNRGLQSFSLGTGAGRYQISITATTPGSQRNWREVAVSELQLVGRGSAAPWALPEPLVVGAGIAPDEPHIAGPYASAQAACTELQRGRDRARCRDLTGCGCTVGQTARLDAAGLQGNNPVLAVRLLTNTTTPDEGPTCSLAVQTAAGWFALGSMGVCGRPDPTSSNLAGYARASIQVRSIAVRNGPNGEPVLRFAYDTDRGMYDMDGYDQENDRGTRWQDRERHSLATQCHFTSSGAPECAFPRAIAPSRVERR